MSTPEVDQGLIKPEALGISALVNDAIRLAAHTKGRAGAVALRAEFQALQRARFGRLVIVSEEGRDALDLIARLVDLPLLSSALSPLPDVHTTYRYGVQHSLTLSSLHETVTVPLGIRGDCPEAEAAAARLAAPVIQLDVSAPAPFLARFAIVHAPDLHADRAVRQELVTLTGRTMLAYVSSSSAPLSQVELDYLSEVGRRTQHVAVVLARTERYTGWPDVEMADNELLSSAGAPGRVVLPTLLMRGLEDIDQGSAAGEMVDMVSVLAQANQFTGETGPTARVRPSDVYAAAEVKLAAVTRDAMGWLPRLGHEFTRLRGDMGEEVASALALLEQRHDQWIQADVEAAAEQLPAVLLQDLRALERRSHGMLDSRLEALGYQFLGGRRQEFLNLPADRCDADGRVRLVDVSRAHTDGRSELFASLGNFGSGRQSLSLVGSVASAAAVPVALVGGLIGLGFWRMGRSTRQDAQLRGHASRWLRVQIAEASRVLRYQVDQDVNDAQLEMNLAVREYYERLGAEARRAVETAHRQQVDAENSERLRSGRAAARSELARDLSARARALGGPS